MIRLATKADIVKIEYLGKFIKENFSDLHDVDNYINDMIKGIYVYEENKEVKGFLLINNLVGEIEILDIAVLPQNRNKNIGFKLCDYVINLHKKSCFLEVSCDNDPAIALYNKLNFKITGTRKNYYGSGIHAYIMERKIK